MDKGQWSKVNFIKTKKKNDVNVEELKKRVTPEMLCHKMPL